MPKSAPVTPFVKKTFDMISETDFREIISWSEDGASFIIWKPQKFRKKIIPLYFKHCNLCSFIRQLNTYGFHKVNRTKKDDSKQLTNESYQDVLEFRHASFLRDRKDLLCEIERKKAKNSKSENDNKDSESSSCNSSAKSSPISSPNSESLCQKEVQLQSVIDSNFAFATISSNSPFSSSVSPSPPSTPTPEVAFNIRGYSYSDHCYNLTDSFFSYENEKLKHSEERNKLSKTITYLSLQVQQLSEELKFSQAKIRELEGELVMVNQFSFGDFNPHKRRRLSPLYPEPLINYYPDFTTFCQIQDQFAGLS